MLPGMTHPTSPEWLRDFLGIHPFPDLPTIEVDIAPWVQVSRGFLKYLQAGAFHHIVHEHLGPAQVIEDHGSLGSIRKKGIAVEWAGWSWDPGGQHPDWQYRPEALFPPPPALIPWWRRWWTPKIRWKHQAIAIKDMGHFHGGQLPSILDAPCFVQWRRALEDAINGYALEETLPMATTLAGKIRRL
jgi:hypothetical protein